MDERRIPSMDDVITITDKRANELPSDSLISINTGGVALVGFRRRQHKCVPCQPVQVIHPRYDVFHPR